MTRFTYAPEELKQLLAAMPGSADQQVIVGAVLALQDNCDGFIDRVHGSNAGRDTRLRRLKELESVLELFPLDSGVEKALDGVLSRAVAAGTGRNRALADLAIHGDIAWLDFEQYVTRWNIRREIEERSEPSPEEIDAAQGKKAPRDELFASAFAIWAMLSGDRFAESTVSDPEETPAQRFIRAATEPALVKVGLKYPGGKTVANAVRSAKDFQRGRNSGPD